MRRLIYGLILSLLLLLASCSKAKIKVEGIEKTDNQLSRSAFTVNYSASSEDGYYYLSRDSGLYFFDYATKKTLFLNYMTMIDDQRVSSLLAMSSPPKKYHSQISGNDFWYYEGYLYYITWYMNASGTEKYQLSRTNALADTVETVYEFETSPDFFILDQGHVYYSYGTSNAIEKSNPVKYQVCDYEINKGKTNCFNTAIDMVSEMKLVGSRLYFRGNKADISDQRLYAGYYDLETKESGLLFEPDTVILAVTEDWLAAYTFTFNHPDDPSDLAYTSTLYDMNQNPIFTLSERIMAFIDDGVVYTYSMTAPQSWEIYDLKGNWIETIPLPETTISNADNMTYVGFRKMAFSGMLKKKGNYLFGSISTTDTDIYYMYDLSQRTWQRISE